MTNVLVENLLSAIVRYRVWFDTCTRTEAPKWEDRAYEASKGLDNAIEAVTKFFTEPGREIVRVLRVVEYVGEREVVENQINNSLHGVKVLVGKARKRGY